MKRLLACLICIYAVGAFALSLSDTEPNRALATQTHDNGTISITTTNYGCEENMQFMHQTKLIYQSASWISGKKNRRDLEGRLLYWLTYPPSSYNNQTVTQNDPQWTPDLVIVQDTLSTVGYDGDIDLYELLPAYNPYLQSNTDITQLYDTYNQQDIVLQSIMGDPAPLPFDPFNSTNFCFSIPQPGSFETPGFITNSAYYYDYCPFGTMGDRDFGGSHSSSTHIPLGLAVHQESYSWNLQNHHKMFISKYTAYNTNADDSIDDLAISHYMDADIGPSSWGSEIAADDASGYVKGEGYEFAYSRDYDFDGGLSPMYIGSKLIIPAFTGGHHAWYWKVGDGPDDRHPQGLNYTPHRTANEKYWLATGRNPNQTKFAPLRPEQSDQMEYEQPTPNDTRVLNTMFGAVPGSPEYGETDTQGNYIYRLKLAPHESITYYTVLFVGSSLDELKASSLEIEAFLANDMQIDSNSNLTCIPYLAPIQDEAPDTFHLSWYSYTNPDHFEVAYKEYGAPATTWNIANLPGTARNHSLTGMDGSTWYEIKVGSVYYNPEEVYLESEIRLVTLAFSSIEDAIPKVGNYPNPFRATTNIEYVLKNPADIIFDIFNLRGQKVRSLAEGHCLSGTHYLTWDGKDDGGKACGSGVYYLRLKSDSHDIQRKMLLVK